MLKPFNEVAMVNLDKVKLVIMFALEFLLIYSVRYLNVYVVSCGYTSKGPAIYKCVLRDRMNFGIMKTFRAICGVIRFIYNGSLGSFLGIEMGL